MRRELAWPVMAPLEEIPHHTPVAPAPSAASWEASLMPYPLWTRVRVSVIGRVRVRVTFVDMDQELTILPPILVHMAPHLQPGMPSEQRLIGLGCDAKGQGKVQTWNVASWTMQGSHEPFWSSYRSPKGRTSSGSRDKQATTCRPEKGLCVIHHAASCVGMGGNQSVSG